MREYDDKITRAWQLYERGRTYNNRLTPNQYNLVETNTEFFIGNQWLNLPNTPAMRNLPKPTFNILKRVTDLFVASLTSTESSIHFEPLAYQSGGPSPQEGEDAAAFANAEVANLLNKFDFAHVVRDALKDGAQTGDYCAHFWFDPEAEPYGGAFGEEKGEIRMELVDGINVMFGNPNTNETENQPYILIVGRDTVANLRREAEQFKQNKGLYADGKANPTAGQDDDGIAYDSDYHLMPGVGGKTELDPDDEDGKALYVLLYEKEWAYEEKTGPDGEIIFEDVFDGDGLPVFEKGKNGEIATDEFGAPVVKRRAAKHWKQTIRVSKMTKTAVIYENVDTGLSYYPIAWGNWEKQRNQYHGRALITGLIPNQIFINRMYAMAMRHMQQMAFPTIVYNRDIIPAWAGGIGQAIGVRGLQPGQAVNQVVHVLPVAEMSGQLLNVVDRAVALTKECLGATDAQLGSAKAENTSALVVAQTNSEVPLENYRSGLYKWVKAIGKILLDMIGTYYGIRTVAVDEEWTEFAHDAAGNVIYDAITGVAKTQTVTQKVTKEFDFSIFKRLWLNMKVDVCPTSYLSEAAIVQTLNTLRSDGTLSMQQYLERMPDNYIPRKAELIQEIKGSIARGEQPYAGPGQAIPQPGSPVSASADTLSEGLQIGGLPTAAEAAYDAMPNIAKTTARAQGALRVR